MKLLANFLPFLALAAFGLVGFKLYEDQQTFQASPEGKRQAENEKHTSMGLEKTLDTARAENKRAVVIFTASWCGSCQFFKKDVLPNQQVQSQLGRFTWAFLDVDDRSNREANQKFGIHGVPTIIVLNNQGKELERIVGAPDVDEFNQFLAKY